ncbi:murein biosynthesis integral membrane protein MurJ [Candidatus Uhrbacteria bacterium]|nr:murein biosynthesis integral membrane protein MurJ [Candidatus Uhrbacteria bacterium]
MSSPDSVVPPHSVVHAVPRPVRGTSGASAVVASAALIALLSLASRVLGLVRDRVLASLYGAGATLDAYYAAFRIPDFVFNLIGLGALSAAFLPVFVRLRQESREQSFRFAARLSSDAVVVLAVLCGAGVVFAGFLVRIIAPGFTDAQLALTTQMSRLLFAATFLLGVSTVAGGVLQAEQRFVAFAAAPLLYNVGIIAGAVGIAPFFGPMGLAWGVVGGALLHAAVQVIAAWRLGFRWSWLPTWKDRDVRATARLLLPRMFGLASQQIQLMVLSAIASTLAVGSLAVFTFANNIQHVPLSLIGISYAIAVFPQLAATASRDRTVFAERLGSTIRQILLFAIPATVFLLTLKAQIVRVFLGAGAFDWQDTRRTLEVVEAMGLGLTPAMLIPSLARAYYALEDTRTPFMIGVSIDVAGIVLAGFLGYRMGPRGLALGLSIAAAVHMAVLLAVLRLRISSLDGRALMVAAGKYGIAGFIMGLAIQQMKAVVAVFFGTDTFWGIAVQGALAGGVGGMVYLGIGILLRSPEMIDIMRALRRRVLRTIRLPAGGVEEVRG